jgi:hypothetical protein
VVLYKSRETHRPVYGAFREAVVDPAFMPGKRERIIMYSAPFTGLTNRPA